MRGVRDRFSDGSDPRRDRRVAGSKRLVLVGGAFLAAGAIVMVSGVFTSDPSSTTSLVPAETSATAGPGRASSPTPRSTVDHFRSEASDGSGRTSPTAPSTSPFSAPTATPTTPPTQNPLPGDTPTSTGRTGLNPWTAAAKFVDAWLTTEPEQRGAELDLWATPALASGLKLTDPNAVPATTRDLDRPVETIGSSDYQGRYEVFLTDGTSVLVDVVNDGAGGWMASAIAPREE